MTNHAFDRWRHIDAIFSEALDVPLQERATFLDEACAADADLRRDVERLLAADEQAGQFLDPPDAWFDAPSMADSKAGDDAEALDVFGRLVGPYRLLGEIGRGGMGAVYLAERADGQFRQRVALKLVRDGVASEETLRRFRLERQILAGLQHPHIARLLDGGVSEEGTPYFVMEYVAGTPIDQYCDERRLPIAERLRLFGTVCKVVQYAHQNLIVHRDLKPSNILITEEGQVKLLDFGIAKLLDPDAHTVSIAMTQTGVRLMTPEYASPEQVAGNAVTTASDVYQLGVLLYELLTGHRPYRLTSRLLHEVERTIREETPERPSTAISRVVELEENGGTRQITPEHVSRARATTIERLRRRLSGDLDNIVLMALRKEPARRYASAEQLAEDVRRHLDGLPVRARSDTLGYRASKFVRRHRFGVAALAAFMGLVMSFGIVMAIQVERADALSRLLIQTIYATGLTNEPRQSLMMSREQLDGSLDRAREEMRDQPAELAWIMSRLSRVYNHSGFYREAVSLAEETLAMQRQKLSPDHPDMATTLYALGQHQSALGHYEAADTLFRQALDIQRKHYGRIHPAIASSLGAIASILQDMDDLDAAEPFYLEALDMYRALYGDTHLTTASHQRSVGWFFYEKGDYKAADTLLRQSLAIAEMGRDEEARTMETSEILSNLGLVRRVQDDYDAAEAYLRQALDLRQAMLGAEHTRTAQLMNNLGWILQEKGNLDEAERLHRKALAVRRTVLEEDHPHIVESLHNLAVTLWGTGDLDEAETLLREALALEHQRLGDDHLDVAIRRRLVAALLRKKGDHDEAERLYRRALDVLPPGHLQRGLALLGFGSLRMDRADHDEAGPLLREALVIVQQTLPGHWFIAQAQSRLGGCLTALGRFDEAEPLLLDGYAGLQAALSDQDERTVQARAYLAAFYAASGQSAKIAAYRAEG